MKRLVSILLVFLLLYNAFGYLFTYLHLKKTFKKEAFEKIDNFLNHDELVTLGFSNTELDEKVSFVHSREFAFNGEMYDIFSREERNDSVFFKCICDKNENLLEKSFSVYFNKESKKDAKHPYIYNILKNIITTAVIADSRINFFNTQNNLQYIYTEKTILIFPDNETPPPRIV